MFHRVIDRVDPEFAEADPSYTVSTALFEAILRFASQHYTIVGVGDVLDARRTGKRLPDFPLLITFDDGWRDNLVYAAPILRRYGAPAVVFVAAEPLLSSSKAWWQEEIFAAVRAGALRPSGESSELDLVCQVGAMTAADRAAFLSELPVRQRQHRMMLAPHELSELSGQGVSIGVHGFSHIPLTRVADVTADLREARRTILELTNDERAAAVLALPHGRYDDAVIKAAYDEGYELVFSSDPVHMELKSGCLEKKRPIGRIDMVSHFLETPIGDPSESRMATWLWTRASSH